jgi:SAM-dependent methyltransferase
VSNKRTRISPLSLAKKAANIALTPMGHHITAIPKDAVRTSNRKDPAAAAQDGLQPNSQRVLNLLRYTTTSGSDYDAAAFPAGYHSITLDGKAFLGQRRPDERLAKVPFDFKGKSALDIGCNQGGMLHALASQLSWGVGIDYDHRMINAANRVRRHNRDLHLDFYVFDLEKDPLDYIGDFFFSDRVDIVFLLSVCMWIKNWTDVIDWAANKADHMLFESNGSAQQQQEQEDYLRKRYAQVQLISGSSDDDPGQRMRKLYLCSRTPA